MKVILDRQKNFTQFACGHILFAHLDLYFILV